MCGEQFALGDPGLNNVSYVVSGLRANQLKTPAHRLFDKERRDNKNQSNTSTTTSKDGKL